MQIESKGSMVKITKEHVLWAILVPLYFLVGYYGIPYLHGDSLGFQLGFAWEDNIPYFGVMSIPYVLCYGIMLLPAILFPQIYYLRRGAICLLVAMTIAFLTFLIFPVRLVPPAPSSQLDKFLLSIHWLDDGGWNAFPSLHVAIATICILPLLKISRLVSYISIFFWILIFLSTLLLKRHYLVDSLAGVLLGCLCYYFIVEPDFKKRAVRWRL